MPQKLEQGFDMLLLSFDWNTDWVIWVSLSLIGVNFLNLLPRAPLSACYGPLHIIWLDNNFFIPLKF